MQQVEIFRSGEAAHRFKTPEEAFVEFLNLDVAGGNPSPATVLTYRSSLKTFFSWCKASDIRPEMATPFDIKQYRETISKIFAPATTRLKLSCLKRFFDGIVVYAGTRHDNPVLNIRASMRGSGDRIKYLSPEKARLLVYTPDLRKIKGVRDRAMLSLMLGHGLRTCEIANMEISDIVETNITVRGKGGRTRQLPLVKKTQAAIRSWLDVRPNDVKSNSLFIGLQREKRKRTGIGVRGIRKAIDVYLRRVGAKTKGVSCHSLRHTFATCARRNGAGLEFIQAILGHKSIKTTEIYSKIVGVEQNNPAEFVEFLL